MTLFFVAFGVCAFFAIPAMAFVLGALVIAEDAESRLRGRKPVDGFWKRRGMR